MPFVSMLYGSPLLMGGFLGQSTHTITQGECSGCCARERFCSRSLMTCTMPDRVCDIDRLLEKSLRGKDPALECHRREFSRAREIAASSDSCRSRSSGAAGIRGFAITSARHHSVGNTSWPSGCCAHPHGDAQCTSSHIADFHSHGRGRAVGCSWFTVPSLGPTVWPEWLRPRWQRRHVRDMTPGCGSVCAEFSTYLETKAKTWSELLQCLWFWETSSCDQLVE